MEIDFNEYEGWGDSEWLTYFQQRLNDMRSKKQPFIQDWKQYENQNNAISFYDNEGNLNVNIPLEKTLKEIYMGRTEWKIAFDIIPDGQANVDELQPTKYALNFFMDGNDKDNFWKENRLIRDYKATYGTAPVFTGMRCYKDYNYNLKKEFDGKDMTSAELLNEKNYEKTTHETWFFFPQAIHPMDFYVDDAAYGQPDVQYALDCIRKEKISKLEFKMRYADNSAFTNVDDVVAGLDRDPKNDKDKSVGQNEIVLHHYYHRILKKYIIVANENKIIFNGLYLYNDGKLPFEMIHHYFRSDRIWGEGIHERVAYLKAYKSEIFQDILSGAAMSSGIHLVVGNDDQIGQDWSVGWRGVNLWRTTGWADQVTPMNTSPNLGYFIQVLDLLDKQAAVDSGINPNEQFDPGSDKVGIVEVMEANKSIRNRAVDENYNIGLDSILTMMLSRIRQFAPALLKEDVLDSEGKVLKSIFPMIKIDDHEVGIDEKWQTTFTENIGKYGYFELKPEIVKWVGVKVTTPSTNSLLPIFERQKIKDYLENITELANLAQMDPSGEAITKLLSFFNLDEVIWWISDTYGYDTNGLKSNTEKDKISAEVAKKLTNLQNILSIQPQNETTTPQAPSATQDGSTSIPEASPTMWMPWADQMTWAPMWQAPTGAEWSTLWAWL